MVSTRSVFQMRPRSATLTSANEACVFASAATPSFERVAGAEHGGVALHGLLHLEPDLGGAARTLGVAEVIEARHGEVAGVLRERRMRLAGLDDRGRMAPGLATEHHEIE